MDVQWSVICGYINVCCAVCSLSLLGLHVFTVDPLFIAE